MCRPGVTDNISAYPNEYIYVNMFSFLLKLEISDVHRDEHSFEFDIGCKRRGGHHFLWL